MSKLLEKINNDLKEARREKNELVVSVLRLLISAVHNKEISLRKGDRADLTDEQIIEVIKFEIKKRKDSIEAYTRGGRPDLAEKEEKEKAILEKYLPAQINDEDLKKIVKEIIEAQVEEDRKNFGKIMGLVMGRLKDQVDGQRVSAVVKNFLGK